MKRNTLRCTARVSALSSGSPSGAMPMLSGDFRTIKVSGTPMSKNSEPEISAA